MIREVRSGPGRPPLALLLTAQRRLLTSARVEVVLKDDSRSCRIQPCLPPTPALYAIGQPRFRLVTGQSFVLDVDRQHDSTAQPLDKPKDVSSLPVGLPIQRARQPHHNGSQAVTLPLQGRDFSGDDIDPLLEGPGDVENAQRPRQHGRNVTNGKPNPSLANVDTEDTHTSTIMVAMSQRTRLIILFATIPVVVFTMVGGFLGQAVAREDAYRHLRIFEDVVSLISKNYVEEVELDAVMDGALKGLAGGLDTDSTYLTRIDVSRVESRAPLPDGALGLEVTSRYYLQIIAARPDSPAARAGLVPGDFIRAIDGQSTRQLSALEGRVRLRGEPGSTVTLSLLRGNTAEPYDLQLTRQRLTAPAVTTRTVDGNIGYLRVSTFAAGAADEIGTAVESLVDRRARALLIDVRNAAGGSFEEGISAARLFVDAGTLLRRVEQRDREIVVEANAGSEAIDTPLVLLTNLGTAHAAELFVAGLSSAGRADTVGQRTAGRASLQRLVKLPDGTGLWLSWARYAKASGGPIHRFGVEPTVEVEIPFVELGEPIPPGDPILDQGLLHLRSAVL